MLHAMWAIQVKLEMLGLPIGYVPAGYGLPVVENAEWAKATQASEFRLPAKVSIR